MKCPALITFILLAVLMPLSSTAQVATMLEGEPPRVCPDQPLQPDWVENTPFREAHKQILAQQMYRAQSMQAIVDEGECSCDTRFPAWDQVRELFLEAYADLERWPTNEKTEEYRRQANELRVTAKPICEAQGNW